MDKIIKDILTSETGEAYARRAIGTMTPTLCNSYNDQCSPSAYDPEKAKQLLADADGRTRTATASSTRTARSSRSRSPRTPATRAGTRPRSSSKRSSSRSASRTRLEQIEGNTFYDRLRKKDFEASLAGWSASLLLDPTDLWHSGSQYQFNSTSYANPEVDKLIEPGMSEPDPAKSNAIWRELQAKIYEDQPYLFMYWWDDTVAIHSRFHDATPNILSEVANYWEWWVPPTRSSTRTDPMLAYVFRKVLLAIPLVWGVLTSRSSSSRQRPGTRPDHFVNPETPPEVREFIMKKWGLDQPAYVRYVKMMGNLATGDFGRSIAQERPCSTSSRRRCRSRSCSARSTSSSC
jgi:hypothetical protein